MKTATIRKQKNYKKGKILYQVMIRPDRMFAIWKEEFSSYSKNKTDEVFNTIANSRNINVRR